MKIIETLRYDAFTVEGLWIDCEISDKGIRLYKVINNYGFLPFNTFDKKLAYRVAIDLETKIEVVCFGRRESVKQSIKRNKKTVRKNYRYYQ